MSYSSKLDCLVQITATFYYPGDKVRGADLEEHAWTNATDDDKSRDWINPCEADGQPDPGCQTDMGCAFGENACECDTEITAEAIGFDVEWISEGRTDYNFCCAMDHNASEIGHDWLTEDADTWAKEALERRAVFEAKAAKERADQASLHSLVWGRSDPSPMPVRSFRWIEIAGHWSSRSDYDGEYDAGTEMHGGLTLAEVAEVVKARNNKAMAAAMVAEAPKL